MNPVSNRDRDKHMKKIVEIIKNVTCRARTPIATCY